MSTTNRIFLDSSFFVEHYKGKYLDYHRHITNLDTLECCISDIVCSEYWFHLFAILGGKAPLTIKEAGRIPAIATEHSGRFEFFEKYSLLRSSRKSVRLAWQAIEKYSFLSNDALILGICKAYKIPFLASCDSDFAAACLAEGIALVTPDDYQEVLPPY